MNLSGKTIALCITGNNFTYGMLYSYRNLCVNLTMNGIDWFEAQHNAADMHNCRNKVLLKGADKTKDVKPFGGRHYDYILFIDRDHTFTIDDVEQLVGHDLPVIGAPYSSDAKFLNAGNLLNDGNHRVPATELKRNDVDKVSWVGFGFVLIQHGVFEKLGYPWFQHREVFYPEIGEEGLYGHTSEDIAFGVRCKEKDIPIYLDLSTPVGHEKAAFFDAKLWKEKLQRS